MIQFRPAMRCSIQEFNLNSIAFFEDRLQEEKNTPRPYQSVLIWEVVITFFVFDLLPNSLILLWISFDSLRCKREPWPRSFLLLLLLHPLLLPSSVLLLLTPPSRPTQDHGGRLELNSGYMLHSLLAPPSFSVVLLPLQPSPFPSSSKTPPPYFPSLSLPSCFSLTCPPSLFSIGQL